MLMKNTDKSNGRKKSYSKYYRVFGRSLHECLVMDRVLFAKKFGKQFKYMSISKFKKTINHIARAYSRGKELLPEYE